VESYVLQARPLAGLRAYQSGPGDRFGAIEPTPREAAIKALHQKVRDALLALGTAVVRDRNLPGIARGYDEDKIRFLLRTCDMLVAYCYSKEKVEGTWRTSPYVIDEVRAAADAGVSRLVVLYDPDLADAEIDDLRRSLPQASFVEVHPELDPSDVEIQRLLVQACGEVVPVRRQIFTVIPFDKSFDRAFAKVRAILEERTNLPVKRIKDMLTGTATKDVSVFEALLRAIRSSPMVVLELSERNPNCYFEAGIAVASNVPSIRLIREEEEIPFDVRHVSFVKYRSIPDLGRKLAKEADRFAREEVTIEEPHE
jgi:hypothetical protein